MVQNQLNRVYASSRGIIIQKSLKKKKPKRDRFSTAPCYKDNLRRDAIIVEKKKQKRGVYLKG